MKPNGEAGVTLAEVLVASAIGLVIAGFLGTAIYQFFTVTNQGSNVMTAMHQVQNATHWLTIDGQTAIEASSDTDSLVLTLPDDATISYALSDNKLTRTFGGSELTVAQHVSDVSFSIDDRVVTMTITATPDGAWDVSEQRTCKVYLHPSEKIISMAAPISAKTKLSMLFT